ncbi:MAG: helix-turn-helix transcriptional regulator [Clostridiaceae bacterium]|nr:helix-turn-helix transcriptional regulator [Clostridiaceae bacterium]MDO4495874.1 helix-turn-helix transcriptional regulator [Clostridiaceae bacterium]
MKFNQRLKDIREDKDLNQTQFGKILNMSQRKISRLETGETEPTTEEIRTICKTFKVSADWLLGLKN